MSYYENRIKALEERVAKMAMDQRMKAIPVEAKLVQRIAELQAENKALANWKREAETQLKLAEHWVNQSDEIIQRLAKAGDMLAFHYTALGRKVYGNDPLPPSVTEWQEAKKPQ